jgi:nitroimidazol reductase NimA-like FMN-containing flavoprotein (pyridoxamine 5'-phosphate oxidase superfamily)
VQPAIGRIGYGAGTAMSTGTFTTSRRNKLVRHPERGQYDRESIYQILDEGLICHVGFIQDGLPFVIPTLHVRDGDRLLLHGSAASRMIRHLGAGNKACVTVTLVDGLVLARSVFNHSVNYRSAVVYGSGELITDTEAKLRALHCFMERQLPGRWADARQPNEQEVKATGVVALALSQASAKVRVGPPKDDPEDLALPVWAGVLPLRQSFGEPLAATDGPAEQPFPDYLQHYVATRLDTLD